MKIKVGDLIEYLKEYPQDAAIKFAVKEQYGQSTVLDFGFISTSTEEVYGKEVVIHPYFEGESEEQTISEDECPTCGRPMYWDDAERIYYCMEDYAHG